MNASSVWPQERSRVMSTHSPGAWMLSFLLHAFVAAVMAFFAYTGNLNARKEPRILELVAGEGDNFAATVAPALGTSGGVTVDVPEPIAPKAAPPEPVREEVAPITPAPTPVVPAPAPKTIPAPPKAAPAPVKKAEPTVPNFEKKLRYEVIKGESRAKLQLKRERAAAAKRAAEEKKRLAAEAKKMTKADFDAKNKTKTRTAPAKGAPVKVAKVDAAGIAKGVLGGSRENTKGGAGGKALVSNHDNALDAYYAFFKQDLRKWFEPPPGLSDSLAVTIEVRSNANGSLTNARVRKTSGSREFDRAVLDAIARVRMPPRPGGGSEAFTFVFTMREQNDL